MPVTTTMPNDLTWEEKASLPQVTLRSTLAGLAIGSVILASNFQFGLQTGWVSMMSLPSALLGFSVFKTLQDRLEYRFTDVENVFVQSVAVAVATGPLAYGFVGIIPAIEKLMTDDESGTPGGIVLPIWKLIVWSLGLAFFGVFFAVPLRKQFIIKEKLAFPSGNATATLISVFHGTTLNVDGDYRRKPSTATEPDSETAPTPNNVTIVESQDICKLRQVEAYQNNIKLLASTASVSSVYTICSYFVPQIRNLPLFGKTLAQKYLFTFQPSPSYIGQGMIMGIYTTSYMLFGMILGWGVLGPLAKARGWAPGAVDDWKDGSEGWIMWISLSIMISDSVVSFMVIIARSVRQLVKQYVSSGSTTKTSVGAEIQRLIDNENEVPSDEDISNSTYHGDGAVISKSGPSGDVDSGVSDSDSDLEPDVDSRFQVSGTVTAIGLVVSCIGCVVCTRMVFGAIVPVYAIVTAVILSLFLSVLGIRALGETDLNPVSGIGKLSQLIFAVIIPRDHPGAIMTNLISGAISEAATQQAGDLLQDLKTGYMLGASPKAQFVAQIYGSVFSIVLSALMYKLYNSIYEIPGQMFKIPTAIIWIDCARLVNGSGLPPRVFEFSMAFGVVFGLISLLKNTLGPKSSWHRYLVYLPSGIPVGIGIYNVPSFTIARFIGGVVSYLWLRKVVERGSSLGSDERVRMIIFSSGLVLGEGLFSVVNLVMTSFGVPHL